MFTRFDTNKSTKGASKLRRDLINAEIANLRELLPLPPSSRQRLSQLQLMALVCVYVRKENYFQQVFKRPDMKMQQNPTPNIGFSKALCGFLMMMTRNGKLLYISDNATEYLGHSMEDLLIHGDSVYDIIDKQDHQAIQDELGRTVLSNVVSGVRMSSNSPVQNDDICSPIEQSRIFLCRMNVSRNARRQMRFGDQKVVLVRGHFMSVLPICSRNEPVFLATCTPIAMPETRECVVQGSTNVFTSIHSLDMKFLHIDKNGEYYLEYTKDELHGSSWYRFLHWECICEAQAKHRSIIQSEQDRTCILLVRLQRRSGGWLWVHSVLQVKDNLDNSENSVIVCTNQVLSENEAIVMYTNAWLYHCYMVQNKLQYGFTTYESRTSSDIFTYCQRNTKQYYTQNNMSFQGAGSYIHNNRLSRDSIFSQTVNLQTQQKYSDQYQNRSNINQHNMSKLSCDSEPVDYSIHTNSNENFKTVTMEVPTTVSKSIMIPFHNKRRIRRMTTLTSVDLEPLKLNSISLESAPNCLANDLEHMCLPSPGSGSGSGSEIVFLPTAATSITLQYALARSKLTPKSSVYGEIDIRDEYNSSPPWSESVQKVPDILNQETISYSNTRSLPGSVSPTTTRSTYMTFTFDWPSEHNVPNITSSNVKLSLNSNLKINTSENQYEC